MPVAGIIIGAASLAEGGIQAISAAEKAKQARNAIRNLQTPAYVPSKAINDYYQMALNRYNAGPYNSLQYQLAQKAAGTGLGANLAGSTTRRQGPQFTGAAVGQYQNQLQSAGVAAQRQQQGEFAQVGQATGMQAGEQKYAFQQNQVAPYQKNLQLQYAMLGGANQVLGAGLSNINSGLSTGAMAGQSVYNYNNPNGPLNSTNAGGGMYNNPYGYGGYNPYGSPYMRGALGASQ